MREKLDQLAACTGYCVCGKFKTLTPGFNTAHSRRSLGQKPIQYCQAKAQDEKQVKHRYVFTGAAKHL